MRRKKIKSTDSLKKTSSYRVTVSMNKKFGDKNIPKYRKLMEKEAIDGIIERIREDIEIYEIHDTDVYPNMIQVMARLPEITSTII